MLTTDTLHVLYFPAALALGALHALEPGHAKALTASYLIGIKGTKKDSAILGLSVAITHSLVVISISSFALWLGNEAFAGNAVRWLEYASGFVAIAIGSWMLYRRLFIKRKPHSHDHSHKQDHSHPHDGDDDHDHHHHDHDHLDDEAHAAAHAAQLPSYVNSGERPSVSQIIAFGAAGGMIPCPASITVMLLALSTGRTGMGLFTVLGFSLGLAITLVGMGLLVVSGLSQLSKAGKLHWITRRAPVASAILVILSGVFALFVAR